MSSRRKNLDTSQPQNHLAQQHFPGIPVKARVWGQGQRCQACTVAGHFSLMAVDIATQRGSHSPKNKGTHMSTSNSIAHTNQHSGSLAQTQDADQNPIPNQ